MSIQVKIENHVPVELNINETSIYKANGSAYLCTLPDGEKFITFDYNLAKRVAELDGSWIEYSFFPSHV